MHRYVRKMGNENRKFWQLGELSLSLSLSLSRSLSLCVCVCVRVCVFIAVWQPKNVSPYSIVVHMFWSFVVIGTIHYFGHISKQQLM